MYGRTRRLRATASVPILITQSALLASSSLATVSHAHHTPRSSFSHLPLPAPLAPASAGSKEVAMDERVRVQEEFEKGVTKVLI